MAINAKLQANEKNGAKPRLGISACLLGGAVRYNGGHCRDRYILMELSKFFDWMSVCPEVEMGMSVPRETIRLTAGEHGPKLVGNKSGVDYSGQMARWSEHKLAVLDAMKLHGFILKKGSPSCGMERVPIYGRKGQPTAKGSGLFAAALRDRFPLMPLEEEGRLNDKRLRETFIESVYAYKRWRDLAESDPKPGALVRFHTEHKYQLLAHDEGIFRELGRLTAESGARPMDELLDEYGRLFMTAMRKPTGQKAHANVMYHLMGFLKHDLEGDDKRELTGLIESFRNNRHPVNVPLTMLKHYFRKFPNEWVQVQRYLAPYPNEFNMRSLV